MDTRPPERVRLREAFVVWAKIAALSFGGPAAHVALMHKELVERRKWINEERFLHAMNYCMLLPGPEAQQLAIYIGWLMHKTRGGIMAGVLFVLPGLVSILALSLLYAEYREVSTVSALFFGLKAAVFAVVVEAVLRIGKRALKTRLMKLFAALSFVAIFFFAVPFPFIVLGAGTLGLLGGRLFPAAPLKTAVVSPDAAHETLLDHMAARGELGHTLPSLGRSARVLLVCGLLWAAPIVFFGLILGPESVFYQESVFFSKTAVVTFGGAYAVLAYIAQRAVQTYGWLLPGEMLDGLGLAETTPGPLIMVVQFVGFMGAYRNPGALSPIVAGIVGSLVTVWVTFVPCFLWIFLGAPYIESLRGNRLLQAGLSAITAAVVGVILNLSLWFGAHVMFREVTTVTTGPLHVIVPTWSTIDLLAAGLAAGAMVAMFRFKLSMPKTLAASAFVGAVLKLGL